MISVEEELVDSISGVFYHLGAGRIPAPIPIPAEFPDNEVHQLLTYVNRFLTEFAPFAEAMEQIAQGELDTRPLLGRMAIVNSYKTLQANLRHLTTQIMNGLARILPPQYRGVYSHCQERESSVCG